MWLLVSNHAWLLVISTWSPPRSLAWQKGSRLDSGLSLKLLGLLLLVGSLGSPVSVHGTLLVGPEGTLWWAALVLLLQFQSVWFRRIGGFFLTLLFVRTLSILDGYLRFHIRSSASSAAEAALPGGPVRDGGLVLGGGAFLVHTVRLGGPSVRLARRNFADPLEGSDVFLYHDASTAVLLDLRRRFKAVVDVLRAVKRSLSRLYYCCCFCCCVLCVVVVWDTVECVCMYTPHNARVQAKS